MGSDVVLRERGCAALLGGVLVRVLLLGALVPLRVAARPRSRGRKLVTPPHEANRHGPAGPTRAYMIVVVRYGSTRDRV